MPRRPESYYTRKNAKPQAEKRARLAHRARNAIRQNILLYLFHKKRETMPEKSSERAFSTSTNATPRPLANALILANICLLNIEWFLFFAILACIRLNRKVFVTRETQQEDAFRTERHSSSDSRLQRHLNPLRAAHRLLP